MEHDLLNLKLGADGIRKGEHRAGAHDEPRWIYALRRREANAGQLPYRFDPNPPSKTQLFKRLLRELLGMRGGD